MGAPPVAEKQPERVAAVGRKQACFARRSFCGPMWASAPTFASLVQPLQNMQRDQHLQKDKENIDT